MVIITPILDRATREAVAELRIRGFDSVVISPSMVEIESGLLGAGDEKIRVARAILRLERQWDISRLRHYAPVADWSPGQPLALALKEVETRRRAVLR